MLFHVIPEAAFSPGTFKEAWRVQGNEKKDVFVPTGNYYQRYNADGFLCHSNRAVAGRPADKEDGYWAYTQLFRSGIVEYAFTTFYRHPIGVQIPLIDGQDVEQTLIQCYENAVTRYEREGRAGIVYVGFSIVGIEGKQIFSTIRLWSPREHGTGIRQDTFTSPEIMVELNEPEEKPYTRTLRPLVDILWQLDGIEQTPFMVGGEWNPFRRYD
jgi:hypothetical protein